MPARSNWAATPEPRRCRTAWTAARDDRGLWLRLHGWRILARRAKVRGGEIDRIAMRGRKVAFVEVKQRAVQRYAPNGEDVRIDAIFIVQGRFTRHVANIWHG